MQHRTFTTGLVAVLLIITTLPIPAVAQEELRPTGPFELVPVEESNPATAISVWLDAGNWTSPITGAVYRVDKQSVLPNYVYDGSQLESPVRYTSPSGSVYYSWQDVVNGEIELSGHPHNIYRASKPLRDAYLANDLQARDLVVTLKTQPLLAKAPEIWQAHAAELEAANERARTNTDPNMTEQYGQEIEDLLQSIRTEILDAAATDHATAQANAIVNLTLAGFPGALPLGSIMAMVTVRAPAATLDQLTAVPDVFYVEEDLKGHITLSTSSTVTGRDTFLNNGFNGGSMDVAVVDTGIDFTHPAYDGLTWKAARVFHDAAKSDSNYCDSPTDTTDRQGHGTAVAGPVHSEGGGFPWENHKGMITSTSSGLISVKSLFKTCDGGGSYKASDVIAGVDWALKSSPTNGLVAEVLSFSAGSTCGGGSGTLVYYFDSVVWAMNVPVAAAAGNEGDQVGCNINSPGSAYNVFSVGYADDKNTLSRSDDTLNAKSGRGPTSDGRLKPDVIAPGTDIHVPDLKWAAFGWPDFTMSSGSSIATPFVAGAVALDIHAGFGGPTKIKATLMNSANRNELGGSGKPDNNIGHGYMDLTRQWSQFKTNNYYQSGTFTPNAPATTNAVKYFHLASAINSDALTLYWQRHVQYNPSSPSSDFSPASDLDMYVYSEGTNNLLATSNQDPNNWEFVRGSDFGAAHDNIIKVRLTSMGDGLIQSEPWGLAATFDLVARNGPSLSMGSLSVPSRLVNGGQATISTTVTNNGGMRAHNTQVTLAAPSGFTFVGGSATVNLGAIDIGQSKTASWTLNVPTTPCGSPMSFSTSTLSTSYGEKYTASNGPVNSFINCVPIVNIIAPNGGEFWRGTQAIGWQQSDADADPLTVSVSYKRETDQFPTAICVSLSSPPCNWNTATVADGTNYRVRVQASDAWNSATDVSDNVFTVDNTAPSLSHTKSGTQGTSPWWLSAVTVSVTCTDATSGVSSTEWRINSGSWTSFSGSFTDSNEGTHTVEIRCTDRAGNQASQSFSLSIDTRKPTSTASLSGTTGSNGWFKSSVTVTLTCSDPSPGSGCSSQQWRPSSTASWTTYTGSFVISDEGTTNLQHRALDVAGWVGDTTTTPIKIDRIAPTSTASSPSESKTSDSFTVSWSSSDATSGVACTDVEVQTNGGTWSLWQNCNSGSSAVYAGVQGHTYGFRSRARDNAGNVGAFPSSAQTTTYVNIAPTANPGPSQSVSFTENLLWGVTVDGSGSSDPDGQVVQWCWEWGDATPVPQCSTLSASANHKYASPGTYTVRLTVTDNDGRTGSATTTVTVRTI